MTTSKVNTDFIWQDRDIRFDSKSPDLELRKGEVAIETLEQVEDTKGNTGDRGLLVCTNLRFMWIATKKKRVNLSIGLGCVLSIRLSTKSTTLNGPVHSVIIMTKFNTSNFEFIFSVAPPQNQANPGDNAFTKMQRLSRSYENTRLYRDLKLRGAIVKNKELDLLRHEQVYSKIEDVSNLSSEQENVGKLYVTNIRVVWFSDKSDNYNVSIPYIQMKIIKIRASKFGSALVIETLDRSGGYVLGFRADPISRLQGIFKEIQSLYMVFSASPILGVDVQNVDLSVSYGRHLAEIADDVEVDEEATGKTALDTFAEYIAQSGAGGADDIVFDRSLGLAIEKLPATITTEKLWNLFSAEE